VVGDAAADVLWRVKGPVAVVAIAGKAGAVPQPFLARAHPRMIPCRASRLLQAVRTTGYCMVGSVPSDGMEGHVVLGRRQHWMLRGLLVLVLSLLASQRPLLPLHRLPLPPLDATGRYRTGKSFLLNCLLGRPTAGFTVGPTVEACTKGIWMWSTCVFKLCWRRLRVVGAQSPCCASRH
jgi:hypothetical protein